MLAAWHITVGFSFCTVHPTRTYPRPPGPLQGGSTLAVRRVYLVLHHILKELASKRLLADQKNFEQVGGSGRSSRPEDL